MFSNPDPQQASPGRTLLDRLVASGLTAEEVGKALARLQGSLMQMTLANALPVSDLAGLLRTQLAGNLSRTELEGCRRRLHQALDFFETLFYDRGEVAERLDLHIPMAATRAVSALVIHIIVAGLLVGVSIIHLTKMAEDHRPRWGVVNTLVAFISAALAHWGTIVRDAQKDGHKFLLEQVTKVEHLCTSLLQLDLEFKSDPDIATLYHPPRQRLADLRATIGQRLAYSRRRWKIAPAVQELTVLLEDDS